MSKEKEKKIPYALRLEQSLIDKVRESAKDNERSVNAEVRYILRKSLNVK
jgi:hypothetical protein